MSSVVAPSQSVVKSSFDLYMLCLRSEMTCTHLIEALLNSMQQDCVPKARLHICICGDDTEQCGHVGVNHATALGNASHSHLLAQNLCLCTAITLLVQLPHRQNTHAAEHAAAVS